jgi:hypothetical protein
MKIMLAGVKENGAGGERQRLAKQRGALAMAAKA